MYKIADLACGLCNLSREELINNYLFDKIDLYEINRDFLKLIEPLDKIDNVTIYSNNVVSTPDSM